jgi:hypothetical protein
VTPRLHLAAVGPPASGPQRASDVVDGPGHRAPSRRDGWIASFALTVCFDTDNDRTRYDHVGTEVRCSHCAEWLTTWSRADLVRHARKHESELSLDDEGCSGQEPTKGGSIT